MIKIELGVKVVTSEGTIIREYYNPELTKSIQRDLGIPSRMKRAMQQVGRLMEILRNPMEGHSKDGDSS
jgi:hypothetical protein